MPAIADLISGSVNAPLSTIRMLSVSGTVTATGYFVDERGVRVGVSFSGSIPAASAGSQAPVDFADLSGAALPSGAVGARVVLSGPIYWDASSEDKSTSDFKANPTRFGQAINSPEYNAFGRAK